MNIPEPVQLPIPQSFFPGRHFQSAESADMKAFPQAISAFMPDHTDMKHPDQSGNPVLA